METNSIQVDAKADERTCLFCGSSFDFYDGYDGKYCCEACWEADTDYGEDEDEEFV
jgi:hypothetical protein